MIKRILVVVLIMWSVLVVEGACPNPSVPGNFSLAAYLGMWHEIAVSPLVRDTFEYDCYCTTPMFSS